MEHRSRAGTSCSDKERGREIRHRLDSAPLHRDNRLQCFAPSRPRKAHRLLAGVRLRGAVTHSELVEFGKHFGLVRPEILKAPPPLDAVHTAIANSEERLNCLYKLLPKVRRQLFEVVALQKISLALLKNTLSAPGDSRLLGPGRPPWSIELRQAKRRYQECDRQDQKPGSIGRHVIRRTLRGGLHFAGRLLPRCCGPERALIVTFRGAL